jgi:hypothetical protein
VALTEPRLAGPRLKWEIGRRVHHSPTQEYALILDIVDQGREIIEARGGSLMNVLKEEGYVELHSAMAKCGVFY